ncbi:MAG: MerR family transcriptional regulator [Actinomycetaceae bacterium]|nr:MerR family transcriptional regulator [Arcanobacterium sp.]MDD7505755.1 MerR family transcriptional regulator [Actinomycetaceae bacterium]MDY6143646.1 MerR family transcriptional regulator [Arcanobacterium sp.]
MAPSAHEIPSYDYAESAFSWPQNVSHEPTLRIGEVLALLNGEFPFLAASKIRHYESIEIISPHRTPSNQRLFSLADVERLRFALVEQRDRLLNLSQIKELLHQLDLGIAQSEHPGRLRSVPFHDQDKPRPGTRLYKDELADLTGASRSLIEDFISAGILTTDSRGRLTAQSVDIIKYGQLLLDSGMTLRQVRAIYNSAHAHAGAIINMTATERARNTPLAKERANAQITEISALVSHAFKAMLLENIDVELR